jgi:hypothetical protein
LLDSGRPEVFRDLIEIAELSVLALTTALAGPRQDAQTPAEAKLGFDGAEMDWGLSDLKTRQIDDASSGTLSPADIGASPD